MTAKKKVAKRAKKGVKAGTSKAAAAARRAKFVEEYIVNGENATQAYKAAGFTAKNDAVAGVEGGKLLKEPWVAAEIKRRRAESIEKAQEKTNLTAEEMLASLARDIRFDPVRVFKDGTLIDFELMDPDTRRALRGLSFDAKGRPNIKFPEQTTAREQGMKYFGLYEKDNAQKTDPITALLAAIEGREAGFEVKR